jgi:hypothetical protein
VRRCTERDYDSTYRDPKNDIRKSILYHLNLLREGDNEYHPSRFECWDTGEPKPRTYSATASFSITTFKCAVTSLCSFTGTVNSPKVFSGS